MSFVSWFVVWVKNHSLTIKSLNKKRCSTASSSPFLLEIPTISDSSIKFQLYLGVAFPHPQENLQWCFTNFRMYKTNHLGILAKYGPCFLISGMQLGISHFSYVPMWYQSCWPGTKTTLPRASQLCYLWLLIHATHRLFVLEGRNYVL